jgi:hypothetical protein
VEAFLGPFRSHMHADATCCLRLIYQAHTASSISMVTCEWIWMSNHTVCDSTKAVHLNCQARALQDKSAPENADPSSQGSPSNPTLGDFTLPGSADVEGWQALQAPCGHTMSYAPTHSMASVGCLWHKQQFARAMLNQAVSADKAMS